MTLEPLQAFPPLQAMGEFDYCDAPSSPVFRGLFDQGGPSVKSALGELGQDEPASGSK